MGNGIGIAGAIFALGIVFWLAGGDAWVEEKTRQLRLENDQKEHDASRGAGASRPTKPDISGHPAPPKPHADEAAVSASVPARPDGNAGRHMRKFTSLLIAFLVWGAIFFAQAANSVDWLWMMLTMFFVGFPVSAWVARTATGIDPYRLFFH